MNKLKVAVVGCGYLGKFHADKYKKNKNANLVGIVDINTKKFSELKNKFKVPILKDISEIIDKVDAVSIVTPTKDHFSIAKKFIKHKKHVFIEKPYTDSVEQARYLNNQAKKHNLVVQVGHLERFNKAFIELKQLIKKPLFIESNRLSPFKVRGSEIDVIMDLMIHDIDAAIALNKSKIRKISASGIKVITKSIDIANARIIFDNGCVANMSASRISSKIERKIRVFQHNSYFSLDYMNCELKIYRKISNQIKNKNMTFKNNDPIRDEIDSFIDSILNKKKVEVSGEDGLNALVIARKISKQITNDSSV
tara:strand:- start:904 stop:1830 length:927 start_codon:yes stop_codon:yes gene_type:complete